MLSFCCGLGFLPKLHSTLLNEHLLCANLCSRAWDPSVPSFENIFLKNPWPVSALFLLPFLICITGMMLGPSSHSFEKDELSYSMSTCQPSAWHRVRAILISYCYDCFSFIFSFFSSSIHFSFACLLPFPFHREEVWLNSDSVLCGSITRGWEKKNDLN